jgi:hypothetical protein
MAAGAGEGAGAGAVCALATVASAPSSKVAIVVFIKFLLYEKPLTRGVVYLASSRGFGISNTIL